MTDSQPAISVWNLPNVLTMLRVVIVPVFLVCMWQDSPGYWWWALLLFMAAAATDKLDGHLARTRGQVTDFGKMADTLADKLLVAGALVGLSWFGLLTWWIAIPLIVREVAVSVIKAMIARRAAAINPSQGGRIKMALQVMGIGLLLVPASYYLSSGFAGAIQWTGVAVLLVSLVISLWTGLDYARRARQVFSKIPAGS